MAKIVEYRDIPLDDLTIGKGQVRTQDIYKDIEDLAKSIEVQGLLQPIVVCPAREPRKWEILTGQRRFLAHKMLKKERIAAAVLDERTGEAEAKSISITENLIRRKLSGKDLTDAIVYLYNKYGTIKDVTEATGLPYWEVRHHVRYPRLLPELKEMVDDGKIDVNVAVKAQDAATTEDYGNPDPEVAVKLAEEMALMTGPQRKKLVEERKKDPEKPVDDAIEDAKSGGKITQIVATVTQGTHTAVRRFAKQEGTTQDEAAATLIEEALVNHGLLNSKMP